MRLRNRCRNYLLFFNNVCYHSTKYVETARQVLIFFIGTLVGYCFNLLSPGITSKKSMPQLNVKGDNTNISGTSGASIEISPKEPEQPPAEEDN